MQKGKNNVSESSIAYSVPSILLIDAFELSGIAVVNNPSLIIIAESWLNSNIPDAAVEISRKFNAHRRDRPTPGGGVLAVYIWGHTKVQAIM